MNSFKILGIEPTGDIQAIKKAYADAVKLHHPEEDPDGYKKVRDAYQEAMNYAKSHPLTPSTESRNSNDKNLNSTEYNQDNTQDYNFSKVHKENDAFKKDSYANQQYDSTDQEYDFENLKDKRNNQKERLEKERLEKIEKERLKKERLKKEGLKKERLEKERFKKIEKERLEKEQLEKEQLEKERLEKERLEKERLETETFKKEILERETSKRKSLKRDNQNKDFNEQNQYFEQEKDHEILINSNFDFSQLEVSTEENDPAKEKLIEKILDDFYSGYVNISKRGSLKHWKKYFSSEEFKSLQLDTNFTKKFLKQLFQCNEFTISVWEGVFETMLKEWSYDYAGSETEILINNCTKLIENKIKQKLIKKKTKKRKSFSITLDIIIIALLLLFIGDFTQSKAQIDKTELEFTTEYMENLATVIIDDVENKVSFDDTKEAYIVYQIDRKEYTDLRIKFNKNGEKYLRTYLAKISWDIAYQK